MRSSVVRNIPCLRRARRPSGSFTGRNTATCRVTSLPFRIIFQPASATATEPVANANAMDRPAAFEAIDATLGRTPVTVLTGPRQCGKTTPARRFVNPDSVNWFDLESPPDLARLDEPMTALAPLRGAVAIDEVQLRPDLFPVLRVPQAISVRPDPSPPEAPIALPKGIPQRFPRDCRP